MKCSCPMKDVYESCFALIETNLYLDTHPCDTEALSCFAETACKYEEAKKAYSCNYGPLTAQESKGGCYHDWVKGPWPWEGGNC